VIEKVNGLISQFTPATIGLLVFVLTQAGFGLIWLTRLETRVIQLESQNNAQQILLDRLDSRTHDFQLTIAREATIMRGNIEALRADVGRVSEQQQRIIQALDNTFNQLNEHLRTHPR
jgi:hypothetical protein